MLVPFINRLLHWFVTGVSTTVLSLMMLSKGCTIDTLGLVMAIASLFIVVFEFPSGILSDVVGQKKIYLFSLAVSIAGYTVILMTNSVFGLIVGFSLYGIARAFSSGSVEALFINNYIRVEGKENLHKLISWMNSGEIIGLATGALLGGFLPTIWAGIFPTKNKYDGNLLMQIFILAVLLIFTLFSVKELKNGEKEKETLGDHVRNSVNIIFNNRSILLLIIGTMVWGFCFTAIEVFWQPNVKRILGSDSQTWIFGLINSGYFLASLAGLGIINLLLRLRSVPQNLILAISRMIMGILIFVLALSKSILSFTGIYLFLFMINGMVSIPEGTMINTLLPDDKRSSLLSFSSLMLQLGGIIGSVFFSRLVTTLHISGVWMIAGIVFGISGLLYVSIGKPAQ
ncbi:MAG: MFS transporter [Spirochaetae bacterium HGW-Spirochaetae-9]|nr:MAG: MFS transporter [Spirochaetae bacterium HGW-Spirochaetae-9]